MPNMSKAINIKFIEEYILLEDAIDRLLGKNGGVADYIDALKHQRLDERAKEAFDFLKRCRALRNRLTHDKGAIKQISEIGRADVGKLRRLVRAIEKKRDPLSKIRIRNEKANKIKRRRLAIALALAAVLAFTVLVLYFR